MTSQPLSFVLHATDPRCQARAATLTTPHGTIQTPIFMPVGTQGAVRNLTPDQVQAAGAQIVLANTYHLSIRPGEDLVRKAGGLHRFTGQSLPILTDSGGFQVFSLPKKEIVEEGVRFRYSVDGQEVMLSPERSMEIQQALGADIAMVFDECVPYPCPYEYAREAVARTTRWERRSRLAHARPDQALFGIVQGSTFRELRQRSAREILEIGFDGYAIGGLSVGEGLEIMNEVLDYTVPELPIDHPRYLMGVGLPQDILCAIERGIDMMDCVIPTRHARGGILYTFQGRLRIQHARYRRDLYPIDTRCTCYTCQHFSRAYLRHLFLIREVLANTLASIHNIHFYLELVARARQAILEGRFLEYKAEILAHYGGDSATVSGGLVDADDLDEQPSDTEPADDPSERPSRGRESSSRGQRRPAHAHPVEPEHPGKKRLAPTSSSQGSSARKRPRPEVAAAEKRPRPEVAAAEKRPRPEVAARNDARFSPRKKRQR